LLSIPGPTVPYDVYDTPLQERKQRILHDSSILAEGVGGDIIAPDSLVQEVINLVEAPMPIIGRYDVSFLALPKDVLITVYAQLLIGDV
jgi:glycyl-tRNA synthetase